MDFQKLFGGFPLHPTIDLKIVDKKKQKSSLIQPLAFIGAILFLVLGLFLKNGVSRVEAGILVFPSTVGDGYILRTVGSAMTCDQASWDSVHGAIDGTPNYTAATYNYTVSSGCTSNNKAMVTRGFLAFDTSSLPDNAVITGANLKLYVNKKFNSLNDGNDFMVVVQGKQASSTVLARSDYSKAGSSVNNPEEGTNRVDIGDIINNTYNSWQFNSTGLSWVSATGETKLAIREGHDVLNIWPSFLSNQYNAIGYYMAEQIQPTQIPVLEVTYIVPPPSNDTTPPTLSIINPSSGAVISSVINISASASDNDAVAGLQFELDGQNLGQELVSSPYDFSWNTSLVSDGAHVITAHARDATGNVGNSTPVYVDVDNTDPSVNIVVPMSGSILSGLVNVSADASDNVGVAGVQFKLDGINLGVEDVNGSDGWSVSWDTALATNGGHGLTAEARDLAGNIVSSTVVPITTDNLVTAQVKGAVSYVNCSAFAGWSFDTSNTAASNVVQIYVDSALQATLTTNILRADVNNRYAISGNHGFSWAMPSQYKDGNPHTFSVNGLLLISGNATPLTGSGETITCGGPVTASSPNLILIMTDDQVFHTAQYMPLTNAIFDVNGVKFTNGTVSTPLCCPSRGTLLTGQYVRDHGLYRNDALLFDDTTTIATIAKGRGYFTGLMGKYLNNYQAIGSHIAPGWDIWKVFNENSTAYYHYYLNENGELNYYNGVLSSYSTDVLANKAVEFINNAPSSQPLLLYFNPSAPHPPATVAKRHEGLFSSFLNWRPPSYNEADVSDKPVWVKGLSLLTTTRQNNEDALHRRMLESLQAVDEGVKKIVDALSATGRLNNSVIIFTSDNGFSWGEHRWTVKKCVYEECIRVPFYVRAPGVTNRIDASLVQNIDVVSTFLDYMGLTDSTMDGLSLKPLLENPSAPWRSEVYLEYAGDYDATPTTRPIDQSNFVAIRTQQYLYAKYKNGNKELYDLLADPYQLTNVVSSPSYAGLISNFETKLTAFNPNPFATPPNPQFNVPGSGN